MITPRRHSGPVLLFTGHMVDLPGRTTPRFPLAMERLAADAIDAAVAEAAERAPAALGISSAARGGDILFLESCRRRGIARWIVLPFAPERFIDESVSGVESGDWEARFWAAWNAVPEDCREALSGEDPAGPFVAGNLRLVELAQAGSSEVHLITLWNGQAGDGPGGTADVVDRARGMGGAVHWIDSRQLLARISQA